MKRETTAYERILYYLGNTSPMYFAFRAKVKGIIGKNELEEALYKAQQKHPLARVKVEMTKDKKQFITTENVPEIPLIEFNRDEIDWKSLIKEELCKPFDIFKGPMIRVFLIQRENISDVVAVFHHAVCDGLSAVLFLHDVFLFLSNPDMLLNPYTDAPIFLLIKKNILEIIRKRELPDWLKNKEYLKAELKPPKEELFPQPDFAIHNWFFTEDETKKIISLAKENNISVHAILGAVLLEAFAQEFGIKDGYERILQSPVNFKPFLVDEAKEYFGLFNGLLTVSLDCSPEKTILEIAEDIHTKLKEKIDNYEPLDGYYFFNEYLLDNIEDPELYYANRPPSHPMDYDFSLSNLGRIQTQKKYGNYEIEKVYGPIFSAIRGEKVIGVSTHQGRMFFTCIYDKDCFSYDTGSSIIQKALDMFHDIIK